MPPRRGTRTRTAPANTPMTDAAIKALIAQGVTDALAEQEIQRNTNLNGDGSQGSGSGITRLVRPTRECTYSDFPKMSIPELQGNCAVENQVKFATYTVLGAALIWWNSYVKTVGHDAAYDMPWKTLMKMMNVKYCLRSNVMSARPKTMQEAIEIANDLMDQKVRAYVEKQAENKRKFANNNQAQQQLPKRQNVAQDYATGTVKGRIENQVKFATYTVLGAALIWWNSYVKTVGHDAAYDMPWKTLMKMMNVKYCLRSNVMSARPKTMQEAIEIANDLMDQKVRAYVEKQAENKRKFANNNQAQQQLPKRQNVAQAYAAGTGERKEYAETLPLCNKCKFHHNGPALQKLENRNHGNQAEGIEARGMVYALGGRETNQVLDDMEDDINA
nr:reverse transcriptase domain-containing protein [Tanacetum cinerariifolium]